MVFWELVTILVMTEIMIMGKNHTLCLPHRYHVHAIFVYKEHFPPIYLPLVWLTFTTHCIGLSLNSLSFPAMPLVYVLIAYSITAPIIPFLLFI